MLRLAPTSHLEYFIAGLKQAFNWPRVIQLITTSQLVQKTLLKSLALNGVVYLGTLVILETFYNTPDHHLFGYSYTDLTGYPLYLVCLVVNSKFYSQIASLQQSQGLEQSFASMINTVILYGNCALFVRVLHFIPWIGSVLAFFICCIVMSYYCFEYKWIYQDWTIEQRMIYVEQHWAYCLGFGLPATVVTFFLSTLRSGGVFALIYPSYVIMASVATPLPEMAGSDPSIHTNPQNISPSNSDFALPFRIPVFYGVRLMNTLIVNGIQALGGSRGASIVAEKKKDRMGKLV